MHILIVESRADLARLWETPLRADGCAVSLAADQEEAFAVLREAPVDLILLDLALNQGAAWAIADFAQYRCPEARIIVVSSSRFFCDGSIFGLIGNVSAQVARSTPPADIIAMVEHYAAPKAARAHAVPAS